MFAASFSPRFDRDVKMCKKRHWNIDALKVAMSDLMSSDEVPLDQRYRDHALKGRYSGYRSIHVDAAPNPPRDTWVLMYKVVDGEILFTRTGTHAEVYGK